MEILIEIPGDMLRDFLLEITVVQKNVRQKGWGAGGGMGVVVKEGDTGRKVGGVVAADVAGKTA